MVEKAPEVIDKKRDWANPVAEAKFAQCRVKAGDRDAIVGAR
jgi:hypothetical protein